MSVASKFGLSLLIAAGVACHSADALAPAGAFNYATAKYRCGPADGAATEIILSATPMTSPGPLVPFVRIYAAAGLSELNGRSFPVTGNSLVAAWYQPVLTGGVIQATGGSLTVTSVGADQAIEGSVDLDFPDAGRIRGVFHAVWTQGDVGCI